jgi:hypothetical protein
VDTALAPSKISDLVFFESIAIEKHRTVNTGPHTSNTVKALASDNIIRRRAQVITPATHAGKKADKKLTTTLENLIGLFLVAYQI